VNDPDPYPNLAWLREHLPVTQVPTAQGTAWFVTSYEHARALLADRRLGNDPGSPDQGSLLASDPPEHTRLRRLVQASFSPATVEALRPEVTRICVEAIDRFVGTGHADLVAEYAVVVPVAVIHAVLGVPAEHRAEPAAVMDLFYRAAFTEQPGGQAAAKVDAYVERIIDYKRGHPGDDVTTVLIGARERGELRDENELRGLVYALLGAGHTTTVPFLGAAVLRALHHPTRRSADWRPFVEEVLRHDSAVQQSVNRYALADIAVAGVRIAKGDRVVVSIAGANRDPQRFDRPEEFVPDATMPSHLAFGHGLHACIGAALARLEGEVALAELFGRIPEPQLEIEAKEVRWMFGPVLRGPGELPVTFEPRQAHGGGPR
jgi:cytochrome P450